MKNNGVKRLAMSALFLLAGMPFLLAQSQIKVSGKVTDDQKESMIGVSVFEKGTTNGVITDLDGNYMLSVKEGAVIVYSYIGYVTQEKKAVPGVMNVTLKEDTKTLDEVVVVGYGVQKKSSVTGAISQVKPRTCRTVPLVMRLLPCKARLPVCRLSRPLPHRVLRLRYVCAATRPMYLLIRFMWWMVSVCLTSVALILMTLLPWKC